MSHPGTCFICEGQLDDGSETKKVKSKGIKTLIAKSKQKQDNKWKNLESLTELIVHESCRMSYFLAKKTVLPVADKPMASFNFGSNCFLCALPCDLSVKKLLRIVATEQLQHRIECCIEERGDEWSKVIRERIQSINLLRIGAKYHKSCYNQFAYVSKNHDMGRPKLTEREDAFQNVCNYMEQSDECQFSLKELMDKMGDMAIGPKAFKQRLINKYKQDILIIHHKGKPTFVCFRNTGYKILTESWYKSRATTEKDERLRVIRAAADIIREDIRSKVYETSVYPPPAELLYTVEDDIPESLQMFLDNVLLKGKKNREEKLTTKRDSIAHAIISAVRPRSFTSSILLSTGIYLTRKFGSRLIIDVLNSLGFCASYASINLYEASAIMNCEKSVDESAYVQHVFDNADHNVCTLDGFNTFHSMGGICCVTPKSAISHQGDIKRLTRVPKPEQLAAKINVPIICYDRFNGDQLGLKSITFGDVSQLDLGQREQLPTAYSLHILAKAMNISNIPSWRGFMETISYDNQYEVSQIYCLPFVNLPPSDMDTINTVLHSAASDCRRLHQQTAFVTFDQPLYIKAREIVANDSSLTNVVVRLGGFHMLMSFLGSIGTIMDGSGLKELLCTVYAGNSVDHMLTGHAFSRAIRGHLIVYTALGSIIAQHLDNTDEQERVHMQKLLEDFSLHPPMLREINNDEILIKVKAKILSIMHKLADVSRTSRLWLQYFRCISLVMQFIEAERLGKWQLHLQCVRDMLPIFHAGGHLAYGKSAQIYLQDMSRLHTVMSPHEYQMFTTEGHFTIRRSDKKWAGIWTDMTVEQTLMRVMKVSGGLTHGRGINKEGVLARWVLGMPIAYEVIEGFETFCGVRASTVEQHTDWRPSSIKRDTEDYLKFVEWLTAHNPFGPTECEELMSIADGLCAGAEVNCDRAIDIGIASMKAMVGVNAADVKLKRTARVKSIATTKRGIVINNEVVAVNTTLLFQRIAAVISDDNQLASRSLNYELAPFPPVLFDDHGEMRKTKKSELYNVFHSQAMSDIVLAQCKIIVDGGFLLHKVVWPLGSTYGEVLQLYQNYITRNYGFDTIVVFDGYKESDAGIKSYERLKRARANRGTQVVFEKDMTVTLTQAKFLSNDRNKDRLINFLMIQLKDAGIAVEQALEDADRLIAMTAIDQLNVHKKVVVVGEDVDLMVLLIALTPVHQEIFLVKPGSGKVGNKLYSTKQHHHFKDSILVSHAFTGCDTTSAILHKGKKTFLNLLKKNEKLLDDVEIFNNANSTRDSIRQAGERLMLALYGAGDGKTSINNYRYERFVSSAARLKTEVRLGQLPPTSASTEEHAWRVYIQVQKWLGNELRLIDWGWQLKDRIYLPIMTKEPPAPEDILNIIHCSCKGNCLSRCGCRKSGLKCSTICSGCHGNSCLNSKTIDISSETSEDSNDSEDIMADPFFPVFNPHPEEVENDETSNQFTQSPEAEDTAEGRETLDDDPDCQPTTSKRPRLD